MKYPVLQNVPLIYRGFLDSLKTVLLTLEQNQDKRKDVSGKSGCPLSYGDPHESKQC